MKKSLVPASQILTAALLPVGVLVFLLCILLWFALGWRGEAAAARTTAAKFEGEATNTQKQLDILKGSKDRVDNAWKALNAGTVKVGAASNNANVGPAVNVSDLPLNKGAAASGGFSGVARRELPESLGALAEADFFIQPQPTGGDRKFRHFGVASDKIEFGRLVPLLASVESRYPMALVEDFLIALPASEEVFGQVPHALDTRVAIRLPVYDPVARAADAKKKAAPVSVATR